MNSERRIKELRLAQELAASITEVKVAEEAEKQEKRQTDAAGLALTAPAAVRKLQSKRQFARNGARAPRGPEDEA